MSRFGESLRGHEPKRSVAQFRCHHAAHARYSGMRKKTPPSHAKLGRRRKPVLRQYDCDGFPLPTQKEILFVKKIAGHIRFVLPDDFGKELWFVRAFLQVFAYGRGGESTSKGEVRRRCNLARQLADEDRPPEDIASKLGLTRFQAEILEEYGLQLASVRRQRDEMTIGIEDGYEECEFEYLPQLDETEWFEADDDASISASMDATMGEAAAIDDPQEDYPD